MKRRTWWLLTYLGVPKVGLLDGNFSVWAKSGQPTTTEKTEIAPKKRVVVFQRKQLASRDTISALLKDPGSSRIVDARSEDEHVGTIKRSKNAGRIPQACHLEWSEFLDKDGRFLTEPELKSKIAKAGIKPGQAVVTHCQGGGRASVDTFVFQRLGHPTSNYYLGWSDWGNDENLPVEVGAKKQP